ncbi:hypothetical protein J9T53_004692 [Salmonella enterica]|nr:hypothetical protein [Salmonella enterica]
MSNGTAVISVNGIEVGAMPLEQYENIVRDVKKDWHTRTASLISYIRFSIRLACRYFYYFATSFLVVFAFFMLYSNFHPAAFTQFIADLQTASPDKIASILRNITQLCFTLTLITLLITFYTKGLPTFVSASQIAINRKIREVMEVPADGQVIVRIKKDGAYGVQ